MPPPHFVQSVELSEQAEDVRQTDTHGICCRQTGVRVSQKGTKFDGYSDIALALLARDYKGFGNQQMTGVLEDVRPNCSSRQCLPDQNEE